MIRIIGPGASNQISSTKKKEKGQRSGGAFGSLLESSSAAEAEEAKPSSTSPVNALFGILAAQIVDDQTPKQQMMERGNRLLDYLDELRHDLLIGRITAQTANKIIQEIKQSRGDFQDPKLKEIIADIELRAAVELAKLGI